MPIRRDLKHHYQTDDWAWANAQVRIRAGGHCEWCGLKDRDIGYRLLGEWVSHPMDKPLPVNTWIVRIVLSVAHLDQNPANNDLSNLACLCQQCHNRHDAQYRVHHRIEGLHAKVKQLSLFEPN